MLGDAQQLPIKLKLQSQLSEKAGSENSWVLLEFGDLGRVKEENPDGFWGLRALKSRDFGECETMNSKWERNAKDEMGN